MNKKTSTVLRSVVRELFEGGAQDPIPDVPGEGWKAPDQTADPAAPQTPQTQMMPSMSPVYAQPQGLSMSPDHRDPSYTGDGTNGPITADDLYPSYKENYEGPQGLAASPDHRTPEYGDEAKDIQYSTFRNKLMPDRNPHGGYDPALGVLNNPEKIPGYNLLGTSAVSGERAIFQQTPDGEYVYRFGQPMGGGALNAMRQDEIFQNNIENVASTARQAGQDIAFNNSINNVANTARQAGQDIAFNNSINHVANTARQAGQDIAFNNSINGVANTARQAGQDIAFNNSINNVANTARQAGSQIALNNATNTVRDNIERVANRFQRDAMQNQIEAHNRTRPNGVDPAVGVYGNVRAHNPRSGYDPALGPVINAANSVKDSVGSLAQPQPWYQGGLNWMKNNKLATAGILGVPAVLAGAHLLNKRRNRNQQNG